MEKEWKKYKCPPWNWDQINILNVKLIFKALYLKNQRKMSINLLLEKM